MKLNAYTTPKSYLLLIVIACSTFSSQAQFADGSFARPPAPQLPVPPSQPSVPPQGVYPNQPPRPINYAPQSPERVSISASAPLSPRPNPTQPPSSVEPPQPLSPTQDDASAKLYALQDSFNQKQSELAKLTQELNDKSRALSKAESKESAKKAVTDWLTENLASTGSKVKIVNDIVVVNVPKAEYKTGKLRPSKDLEDSLKIISQAAVRFASEFDLEVEGHADAVPVREGGKFRDNWDVAYERAYEMAKEIQRLISKQDGLAITSRGSNLPDSTSSDRRVEFHFISKRPSSPVALASPSPTPKEKVRPVKSSATPKASPSSPSAPARKKKKSSSPSPSPSPQNSPSPNIAPATEPPAPSKPLKKDLDAE